jgi:hypothetical protein
MLNRTNQPMTFDQFKSRLTAKFGRVMFDEHGQNGWSSVADILERKPGGTPGPHWCDAAALPRTGRLLGTYNFNVGTGTFYVEV